IGAEGAESGGTSPGYRPLVRDADNETLLSLQQLRLDCWYETGPGVCRAAHGLATRVAFCGVLQERERLTTVFRFRSPGDLPIIHLQLAFAPGSHADLE